MNKSMRPPEETDREFASEAGESPQHGFQGDRGPSATGPFMPPAITIAISREAGSRGGTIALRAGRKLGWHVYHQEILEYIAQEGNFQQFLGGGNLTEEAARWADERLENLLREQNLSQHPSIRELARIVLAIGAQGQSLVIGRGSGYVLPPETTLHVRVVAPLADRIAYMSQWMRLTMEEAANQVELRDRRRAEFISTYFHKQTGDIYQFDLVLNSRLLGEEICAELIADAARAKQAALELRLGAT
jgi:cytidylate kinase